MTKRDNDLGLTGDSIVDLIGFYSECIETLQREVKMFRADRNKLKEIKKEIMNKEKTIKKLKRKSTGE